MRVVQIAVGLAVLQVASSWSFGASVVDYSGSYTTANRNAAQTPSSFATGDYDFDGTSDDRAKILGWNAPFAVNNFVAPLGKTAVLHYGAQIANLNSSADPAFGLVRVGSNSVLQFGNAGGAPGAQSLSAAVIVDKADFLTLSSSGPLGFLSSAGSLSVSLALNGTGDARFVVQNGTQWYLSASSTTGGTFGVDFNPNTELWYAFDPDTNQFFNAASPGTAVTGSTLQDINAFGIYAQFINFDGSGAANATRVNISAFSADLTPVPEPGYVVPVAAIFAGFFFRRMFTSRRHRLTTSAK
jgi:hypothetical protein